MENSQHLYVSIAATLRERIRSGHYAAGTLLPSQRGLRQEFQVNRRTIARSIQCLEEEGLVQTRRGARTLVVQRPASLRRNRRTGLVALVVPGSPEAGHSSLIARGCQRALGDAEMTMTYADTHGSSPLESQQIERRELERAKQHGVDGVILWPQYGHTNSALLAEISEQMPLVMVDRRAAEVHTHFVGIDDYQLAYELVSQLAELGHKRIACVQSVAQVTTARDRVAGYCQAVWDAGLSLDPLDFVLAHEGGAHMQMSAQSVRELLHRPEPPTAAFCVNETLARSFCRELALLESRIPEIPIATFGGLDAQGSSAIPGLVLGVEQPWEEIGQQAAGLVVRALESGKRDEPATTIVATAIVSVHSENALQGGENDGKK